VGYAPAEKLARVIDEENGPRAIVSDATLTVFPADMSGDGLTEIVGTIDVAVPADGRAELIAGMARRRRGHQPAKPLPVGSEAPSSLNRGHRGRDTAVCGSGQAYAVTCRRISFDDDDVSPRARRGRPPRRGRLRGRGASFALP
jgi:hypothetical protein